MKKIVGYTSGVFDLFHIGHVNILRNARSMCDHLIVGVSTDELVKYKHKTPVIPYDQRVEVVRACRYVDTVIAQQDMDKFKMWEKLKFDVMFVGDDWHGTEKWKEIEKKLKKVGVNIIYIPYTQNVSSTLINEILQDQRKEVLNLETEDKKKRKVSVVIPVYKPDEKTFNYLKDMLKKQTVPVEIIEKWNNPEPVSMNLGIKEASGDYVIILAQDCVPADEHFVERLIKPLEDSSVVAVVSDLYLPRKFWKERPFLVRMFTINDLKIRKPDMNLSSCAYRKRDLEKIGYVNENVSAIDVDFNIKIRRLGNIAKGNTVVYHIHPHKNYRKTIRTFFAYSKYNGIAVRDNGTKEWAFFQKILRAIPFFGLSSIYYRYPLKRYSYLLPLHLFVAGSIEHVINVAGFWQGFLFGDEEGGGRNKEALKTENKK